TFKDSHPLGSGPFTMSHCSPQVMKYSKNAHYWQKGKPKISTVYYPAYTSNDPANQDLASGKAQWGSQFIPSINAFYLSKSKDNPTKAKQILQHAGYKFSNGVFHTKSGKPLSFTMVNIGGYSDWVASAQIVIANLKAIGIKVTASNLSSTTYDNDVYTGKYDLAYDGNEAGGPAPYYELRQELYSPNSAPIGKTASSNWERYYNKRVDRLINAYAATTSSAKQHAIVNQLEAAMVRDVPIIPITEGVDWYQYNTNEIHG